MKRDDWWVPAGWAWFALWVSIATLITIRNSPLWQILLWWCWNVPLAALVVRSSYSIRKSKRAIKRLQREIDIFERRPQG